MKLSMEAIVFRRDIEKVQKNQGKSLSLEIFHEIFFKYAGSKIVSDYFSMDLNVLYYLMACNDEQNEYA